MNKQSSMEVIATALVLIVATVFIYMQSSKFLKEYAVGQCLQAGIEEYGYPEDNAKSTTPNMEAYRDCMNLMGFSADGQK
ncbi:hypothetical protein A3B48_03675 [Candidatus Gottesmanbacteria bacterium RIFCSPLOWO2_01_FULL_40_10]|uniref:Uncharacterized protein n=1 Tax=Candidatus Gottesmanbacteria bacterium RIFCSPHIGHO2_01_FULL_40_15 TaxID=1798376 RepID=A0A1F5Z7K0_9BACT|nr:MAG: hypothetical protein A2777_06195 [Candidatus Gottesmanbacteria bacterium RIFCSPHIGHO2_01_FULL_40_15]OGG21014.1 MAG: hypothetical protein A3B48_03675 [Candidatus Gottesmanbacteria bacterium RIFCSPLOWO2_01_FULL_40_10]OGG25037.1 MAG: hypothetical protein A3E42_05075 [Candidatus Gottesmanbacteria bacterium RIFCSPHIGHO2_12_FULL_40_13]OGG33865.1 MAG: hypothetical protein A3I80_01240 [Candidatus Gottesmanbacteria bacterium RIFCSPLOWO2_02_FULL_40_10]